MHHRICVCVVYCTHARSERVSSMQSNRNRDGDIYVSIYTERTRLLRMCSYGTSSLTAVRTDARVRAHARCMGIDNFMHACVRIVRSTHACARATDLDHAASRARCKKPIKRRGRGVSSVYSGAHARRSYPCFNARQIAHNTTYVWVCVCVCLHVICCNALHDTTMTVIVIGSVSARAPNEINVIDVWIQYLEHRCHDIIRALHARV